MPVEERLFSSLRNGPGYIDGEWFTDSDLGRVPEDTVFLRLENARISDAGIAVLPALPKLRCLDLDSTKITDAAMKRIAEFQALEELWIEDTAVTDAGLRSLHRLPSLRFVSIIDCEMSEEAVIELQKAIPGIRVH